MPLSDKEEEILQDIERRLYEQDPKFASGVGAGSWKNPLARNIRGGLGLFALGFVSLLAFFFRPILVIGVAAFLLMLVGAVYVYKSVSAAGPEQVTSLRQRTMLAGVVGRLEQRLRSIRNRRES